MAIHDERTDFRMKLKAAKRVDAAATGADLPPPKGEFRTIDISDREGMTVHPLRQVYPSLRVMTFAMCLDPNLAERLGDGQNEGFFLYYDWNDTREPVAFIASQQGRCLTAPTCWRQPEEEVSLFGFDPSAPSTLAKPSLFAGAVREGERWYSWQNYVVGGTPFYTGRDAGHQWLDGFPTEAKNMFTHERGRVAQIAFVPTAMQGVGVNEQTGISSADNRNTVSFLVYAPTYEGRQAINRLHAPQNMRSGIPDVTRSFNADHLLGSSSGVTRGGGYLESNSRGVQPQVVHKTAVGGNISMRVVPDPVGPHAWEAEPTTLIVVYPVTPEVFHGYQESSRPRDGLRRI